MSEMKLAVMGAAGRMGRTLLALVQQIDGCCIAGAIECQGSAVLGRDAGLQAGLDEAGVAVSDNPLDVFGKVDGVLDFTAPAASVEFARLAAKAGIVHVIGTTGFTPQDEAAIAAAANHATIIKAGNMSLGVNLLTILTRKAAAALGPDFDIEILEMHHKHKVDAPSGTALMLGEAAAEGRKISLTDKAVRVRDGHTGARRQGDIGFATLRGGSVVGEHTVMFAGEGERIELTHRAGDRGIFARGAVKAALWGYNGGAVKGPGLFSMADVLGL